MNTTDSNVTKTETLNKAERAAARANNKKLEADALKLCTAEMRKLSFALFVMDFNYITQNLSLSKDRAIGLNHAMISHWRKFSLYDDRTFLSYLYTELVADEQLAACLWLHRHVGLPNVRDIKPFKDNTGTLVDYKKAADMATRYRKLHFKGRKNDEANAIAYMRMVKQQ